MKISPIVALTGMLLLAGCSSSSSSTTVNEIQDMSVPVIHSEGTATADTATVNSCYKDNAQRISELEFSLKSTMQDVKPDEVLDTHSDAHRVFTALAKLEQISSMNETYRKDGNVAGLKALNQLLQPLKVPA